MIKSLERIVAHLDKLYNLNNSKVLKFLGIYVSDVSTKSIALVLPWMENGSIEMYLRKHPIPRDPLVGNCLSSLCRELMTYKIMDIIDGLVYLHSENTVHGNLKGVRTTINQSVSNTSDFFMSLLSTTFS